MDREALLLPPLFFFPSREPF